MVREHRFEDLADIDIDGAGFTVGIEHFPLGPSGPFIRVNTGAIELIVRGHATDIIAMSDAFSKVRKVLDEKPSKKTKKKASL